VLAPTLATPADKDLQAVLPVVEERLNDYLFAHACFQRVAPEEFAAAMRAAKLPVTKLLAGGWAGTPLASKADVVVSVVASKAEGDLLLSLKVVSVRGKVVAGFAETGKMSKVKALCESATDKILDAFPFEGHVIEVAADRLVTSLGKGGDRAVKKAGTFALYRWAPGQPIKLTELGRGKVKVVEEARSDLEVPADLKAKVGDKVVLVPPESAATLAGSLHLTVTAGRRGAERPLGDVSVYRNGTWVGRPRPRGRSRSPFPSEGRSRSSS